MSSTIDPIDEIRAIRDRLSAECDYDLDRIVEATRRQQKESGRTFLSPPAHVQERRAAILKDASAVKGEESVSGRD